MDWIATKHVGKFRRGVVYRKGELGVLGRMAVKAGILVPYVEAKPPKKLSQSQRRKKGWADGEAGVQAGGSPDVRDDSGEEGS